jgi:hypothetical protein
MKEVILINIDKQEVSKDRLDIMKQVINQAFSGEKASDMINRLERNWSPTHRFFNGRIHELDDVTIIFCEKIPSDSQERSPWFLPPGVRSFGDDDYLEQLFINNSHNIEVTRAFNVNGVDIGLGFADETASLFEHYFDLKINGASQPKLEELSSENFELNGILEAGRELIVDIYTKNLLGGEPIRVPYVLCIDQVTNELSIRQARMNSEGMVTWKNDIRTYQAKDGMFGVTEEELKTEVSKLARYAQIETLNQFFENNIEADSVEDTLMNARDLEPYRQALVKAGLIKAPTNKKPSSSARDVGIFASKEVVETLFHHAIHKGLTSIEKIDDLQRGGRYYLTKSRQQTKNTPENERIITLHTAYGDKIYHTHLKLSLLPTKLYCQNSGKGWNLVLDLSQDNDPDSKAEMLSAIFGHIQDCVVRSIDNGKTKTHVELFDFEKYLKTARTPVRADLTDKSEDDIEPSLSSSCSAK